MHNDNDVILVLAWITLFDDLLIQAGLVLLEEFGDANSCVPRDVLEVGQ